jgi:geranylgeranyl pyrophosphate synthase
MAMPVGVCFELLGTVSVVLDAAEDAHDDILQAYGAIGSDEPKAPQDKRQAMAVVINAGVALIGLAWQALLAYGPQYDVLPTKLLAIGALLTKRWTTICHAQHRDLTVGRSPDLTLDEYEQIVAGKAGDIGGVTLEAGAILAGAERQRPLWRTLGIERTIMQQLADDAKDLDQDLAGAQQLSQAVRYGLAVADPAQKQMLLDLVRLSHGSTDQQARRHLVQVLEELGAAHYVLVSLAIHRQRALDALHELALPEATRTWFQHWIAAAADVALPPPDGARIGRM